MAKCPVCGGDAKDEFHPIRKVTRELQPLAVREERECLKADPFLYPSTPPLWFRALKPQGVRLLDIGSVLPDTLGKAEAEFAAAVVVRYHQAKDLTEWQPVSRRQLADFLSVDAMMRDWARNPFWRPEPWLLVERGYVAGWGDDNAPGIVTEKFLDHISNPGDWRKERAGG